MTPEARLAMVTLGRFFDWRNASIVKPETFIKCIEPPSGRCVGGRPQAAAPARPRNLRELIRAIGTIRQDVTFNLALFFKRQMTASTPWAD